MTYKQSVYTPFILIITSLKLTASIEKPNEIREISEKHNHASRLERTVTMWNKSSEDFREDAFSTEDEPEEIFERANPSPNFPSEISKCIETHQYQITENFTQGKNIIMNCFKAALILNMLRYLEEPPRSGMKLFNGLLEFKKISTECNHEYCEKKHNRNFGTFDKKRHEYIRTYKKAMQKLINEKYRLKSYSNHTEEEKTNQLNKINENSQAFMLEVIRNLGNEDVEKSEEETLRKEIADPRLLTVLDALTKEYMVKFRFYPGTSARMTRSSNGGFTFDLEIQDPAEELEEETDESSTREIKDGPQAKDYFDDDDDGGGNIMIRKNKKKKKEIKKKQKKLKKIIPYLLLPLLIQMTLLPFVFKKLFFLAMKALFAGKVALILLGFNLLRNTCIRNENDYNQKIRVEHYGYGKGEEYGAWINGRSFTESSVKTALNETPYRGHKPIS